MNNLTISGRITKQATLSNASVSVANFSIAFSDGKDKYGNYKSSFLECRAFNKTADYVVQKIEKGTLIGLTGKLTINEWEKDGKKYSKPLLVVSSVEILSYSDKSNDSEEEQEEQPQQQQASSKEPIDLDSLDNTNDELPF